MAPVFYAQHGEDRGLLEFFGGAPGFYVDVGANDGLSNSNTAALDRMGWRGLLIEADPSLAEICRKARPSGMVVACAAGDSTRRGSESVFRRVSPGRDKTTGLSTLDDSPDLQRKAMRIGASISKITVPVRSLNDILEKYGAPNAFELLSVDVEGAELEVFRSCDLTRWRPRIIIAEDNSVTGDALVHRYLRRFGYHLACRTGVNNWYVRFPDLHRFAGRRLGLALLQCRWALERYTATVERFFSRQSSGFFVQLGFEIGANGELSGVLERDGWQGFLVEMDEQKETMARRTRNWLQVVRCAIAPEGPAAVSQPWLVPESDCWGLSPHTKAIPQGTPVPSGAVPSELPVRGLGCVLREHGAPQDFELLAIGPSFDAADAARSMDWQYFRPRVVLIDSRAPGQERVRRFLGSVGYRLVHWQAMRFWFVRRAESAGFRRERILLAMRSFLWAFKRVLSSKFFCRQKLHK
jgi:FkbM family methyltransferase